MEKEKIDKNQADQLVINMLIEHTDCSPEVTICTYIDEESKSIYYELKDKIRLTNGFRELIIPFKKIEYFTFLKKALANKGYLNSYIKPIIRKGTLKYEVTYGLLEQTYVRRRK